jgi:hypothetical protein
MSLPKRRGKPHTQKQRPGIPIEPRPLRVIGEVNSDRPILPVSKAVLVSATPSDKRVKHPNPLKSLEPKYNTSFVSWHIFVTTLSMMRSPKQKTAWRSSRRIPLEQSEGQGRNSKDAKRGGGCLRPSLLNPVLAWKSAGQPYISTPP